MLHRRAQNLNLLVRDVLALGGGSRASQIANCRVSEAPASMMVLAEDMMFEPEPLQRDSNAKNKPIELDEEISVDEDEP